MNYAEYDQKRDSLDDELGKVQTHKASTLRGDLHTTFSISEPGQGNSLFMAHRTKDADRLFSTIEQYLKNYYAANKKEIQDLFAYRLSLVEKLQNAKVGRDVSKSRLAAKVVEVVIRNNHSNAAKRLRQLSRNIDQYIARQRQIEYNAEILRKHKKKFAAASGVSEYIQKSIAGIPKSVSIPRTVQLAMRQFRGWETDDRATRICKYGELIKGLSDLVKPEIENNESKDMKIKEPIQRKSTLEQMKVMTVHEIMEMVTFRMNRMNPSHRAQVLFYWQDFHTTVTDGWDWFNGFTNYTLPMMEKMEKLAECLEAENYLPGTSETEIQSVYNHTQSTTEKACSHTPIDTLSGVYNCPNSIDIYAIAKRAQRLAERPGPEEVVKPIEIQFPYNYIPPVNEAVPDKKTLGTEIIYTFGASDKYGHSFAVHTFEEDGKYIHSTPENARRFIDNVYMTLQAAGYHLPRLFTANARLIEMFEHTMNNFDPKEFTDLVPAIKQMKMNALAELKVSREEIKHRLRALVETIDKTIDRFHRWVIATPADSGTQSELNILLRAKKAIQENDYLITINRPAVINTAIIALEHRTSTKIAELKEIILSVATHALMRNRIQSLRSGVKSEELKSKIDEFTEHSMTTTVEKAWDLYKEVVDSVEGFVSSQRFHFLTLSQTSDILTKILVAVSRELDSDRLHYSVLQRLAIIRGVSSYLIAIDEDKSGKIDHEHVRHLIKSYTDYTGREYDLT